MLPSVPIFTVDNFFRHNIWHSIFDQFHFYHIFGDEMIVSSDKTGKGTSRPLIGSWCVLFLGTGWMAIRERSLKYFDAEQVNKYLYFSNQNFTMKGASVKKSYFEVFYGNGPICHSQKFQPSQTPPSRFLPISPIFLTNIRCRYFSLNIWVV